MGDQHNAASFAFNNLETRIAKHVPVMVARVLISGPSATKRLKDPCGGLRASRSLAGVQGTELRSFRFTANNLRVYKDPGYCLNNFLLAHLDILARCVMPSDPSSEPGNEPGIADLRASSGRVPDIIVEEGETTLV